MSQNDLLTLIRALLEGVISYLSIQSRRSNIAGENLEYRVTPVVEHVASIEDGDNRFIDPSQINVKLDSDEPRRVQKRVLPKTNPADELKLEPPD